MEYDHTYVKLHTVVDRFPLSSPESEILKRFDAAHKPPPVIPSVNAAKPPLLSPSYLLYICNMCAHISSFCSA